MRPLPLRLRTPTWPPTSSNKFVAAIRRIRSNSDLARARASWLRKPLVSVDQRPPTSAAKTASLVRLWGPTNSGKTATFLRLAACSATPSCVEQTAPLLRTSVVVQRTHQRGVDGELGAAPQRQAIHHNFQSATVSNRNVQIHVPDKHVRPDSSARLSTHPGSLWSPMRIPDGPTTPLPAHKLHDDGHCMSSGRPHRQLRTDKGRARRRRRKRTTRKRWDGIVVSLLVGATVSAAPAPDPV